VNDGVLERREKALLVLQHWERDNIYFFSWDTKARDRFNVKKMGGGGLPV
jgi:hypothetical protein